MKVNQDTPKSRMVYRNLLRKAREWLEEEAEEQGVDENVIWEAFIDFAMTSCRVEKLNGELDFSFGNTSQPSKDLRVNFRAYLNTSFMSIVQELESQIRVMDTPHDEDTTPDFDGDDDPNE